MSTQSIIQNDLEDVKDNLDKLIACTSEKLTLSAKFGFKYSLTSSDAFLFNYLYELVQNERNCFLIFSDEHSLEQVNRLILKYK